MQRISSSLPSNKSRSTMRNDFITSLLSWRIWVSLAVQDILLRYRGSVLGPFWITISTAITVASMGYLYGILFGIERAAYLPYFTTGMISWNFISSIANESTKILLESKGYLQNIHHPCSLYIFRLVFRNILILAHNLPVYLFVALFFHLPLNSSLFFLLPSLLLLSLNGIFYGTMIAFISARFPDVGAIVTNLLQIVFFITPIMWSPSTLPERYHLFLTLNPFYYFVNLLRYPLLGLSFDSQQIFGICACTLIGFFIFIPMVKTYGKRVIFWL